MSSAWSGNWKQQVVDRLDGLGFESVVRFVGSRPGLSFGELAKELGSDVAHMQLQRLYLEDCLADGHLVEAAAECLARTIAERLPRGWGNGTRLDYRTASALAAWISDMLSRIEQSELEEAALEGIATALRDSVIPPIGWMPTSGRDPLIQQAFQIGLRQSVD